MTIKHLVIYYTMKFDPCMCHQKSPKNLSMKRSTLFGAAVSVFSLFACKKANDSSAQISLTASTTQASVGQTVAVTLSSSANASRWTVSPATGSEAYSITTRKVNYFNFSQAGTYTVSVSAKAIAYDSTSHQSLDSCWNHAGNRACVKGVDSASVQITVSK
jgi:hypothetical protein